MITTAGEITGPLINTSVECCIYFYSLLLLDRKWRQKMTWWNKTQTQVPTQLLKPSRRKLFHKNPVKMENPKLYRYLTMLIDLSTWQFDKVYNWKKYYLSFVLKVEKHEMNGGSKVWYIRRKVILYYENPFVLLVRVDSYFCY